MPTIADLNVAINANTSQYVMGLQSAGKSTEGFTTKGSSAFSKFGKRWRREDWFSLLGQP